MCPGEEGIADHRFPLDGFGVHRLAAGTSVEILHRFPGISQRSACKGHIMTRENREEREPDAPGSGGFGGLDDTWWVYMIECRGRKIYTGIAKDPVARYRRHLAGTGAAFTRMNPPLSMLAKRPCGTRTDALKAERALRRLSPKGKRAWAHGERGRPSSRLPVGREKTENRAGSVHPGRTRPEGGKVP